MNNWPTSSQNIPRRFRAMATLTALATTDGVLEEMAYALDTLKLDGVTTTTSIDDIYLGDTRYDPWFEEMNRRGITLFVHPVPAKASRSVDLGIDVSLLEFMFDTTRMLTNMIFPKAKKRFLEDQDHFHAWRRHDSILDNAYRNS
jgi:hypothetical protein